MKLLTFAEQSQALPRPGVVVDDKFVIDLSRIGGAGFDTSSILGLIAAGPTALVWLQEQLRVNHERIPLESVHVLAPIPRPVRNVFCVGWNYVAHFEEGAKTRASAVELPNHPTFFSKATTAVVGPFDAISIDRSITERLDWEAELAVIIGKPGRNISEATAMEHVWGYTVLNDITGRDIQRRHGNQWFKGKSLDASCPMGPWIVTADALDAGNLSIACRVNGVTKQSSNTRHMYFGIARVIAELSHGLTLEAGDIIATGTPDGVGHARIPPEFLDQGDVVETEISGIGTLRNVIGPS